MIIGRVFQGRPNCRIVPLMAVNRAIMLVLFKSFVVITGGQQTMNLNSWNSFQGQHNGMSRDKPFMLPFIWPFHGALQGIKQGDIDLIRLLDIILCCSPGNFTAKPLHGRNQDSNFTVRQ